MKKIELSNYYDKFTDKQKLSHADKKGALFYYEWFDMLYEMCSVEEAGTLLLALLYYDKFGGSKPLPEGLQERLESDRAMTMIFLSFMDKLAASSREWINRHNVNPRKKKGKTDGDSKLCEDFIDPFEEELY